MTLIRTNRDLFPALNGMFDDFFNTEMNDWRQSNFSSTNTTLPKVNIRENDDGFQVEMAAPGMTKNDFNINVEQNILTISSSKEAEEKDEDSRYTKREFAYQSFQRSFTLPDTADGEKISAKYENGILEVNIPKREEAKPKPPRKITIA